MMINAQTKIGTLLKHRPEALEAIISINPKFEKLRNPILRKLMAGRTSIAMASKIAGCRVEDFFEKLEPLGFEAAGEEQKQNLTVEKKEAPGFLRDLQPGQLVELDVRPDLAGGGDPLQRIMKSANSLQKNQVLLIINTFEPVPLMLLLKKRGFESFAEQTAPDLVHTYFYRVADIPAADPVAGPVSQEAWDEILARYKDRLITIDVRELEMPGPMMKILETLNQLPEGKALFVYHKRIPVFLLPELAERKLEFRAREIREGEVHLIIFKP